MLKDKCSDVAAVSDRLCGKDWKVSAMLDVAWDDLSQARRLAVLG